MNYTSEEEFLKHYNPNDFAQLSMTSDVLIVSVSDEEVSNYRKTSNKKMSVLLVKRKNYPYKDKWCLPGGFLDVKKETLEQCAQRILHQETNLKDIYLEQLYTFDRVERDPRMRVVSTSFLALVDKNKLTRNLSEEASWFDLTLLEEDNIVDITLDNGVTVIHLKIKKVLKEPTTDRYQFNTLKNNDLAFDHDIVILSGLERLKNKLEYTDVVFNMMPELFTLGELQQVYEVILGKKLLDPAFRRIIEKKVEKTSQMKTGGGHRPSAMFRYKNRNQSK